MGVYYTLRGYGLKTKTYSLPKPDITFTLDELLNNLSNVELPAVKILVTGNGRVSHGAQYVLNHIKAKQLSEREFLTSNQVDSISFAVAGAESLVKSNNNEPFDSLDFRSNPKNYHSDFMRWAKATDILICAHFWAADAPVYLSAEDLKNPDLRIRMIGDVTCDIMGSIQSTLRSSTHAAPYYDYNPVTEKEEAAFSSSH